MKNYFTCDPFLQNYLVLKNAISVNLGQLTHDIVRSINAGYFIRLRNLSKLVEKNLIDFLLGTNSVTLYYTWRVVDDNHKTIQNKKKNIFFITINFFMLLMLHRH